MSKKGGGANRVADETRADELARQQRIREGTASINKTFDGQFTPDYFSGVQKSYLDYAKPQINDQYADAQKELTYALARAGNLASSTRAGQAADLQKQFDLQMQKATDDALNYQTQARTSVEDARANLIATLNATGDADQATTSALARAKALSQPAAYSPLTDLFSAYVDALGASTAAARAQSYGWGGTSSSPYPTYSNGGYSGSVAVRK